jgi:malonyl-CoA O-methyltransferase
LFDKRQIARQFDRSASRYENFDSLQRMMNDELLAWAGDSSRIVDLGCGNGRALGKMAITQPDSIRIGIDISEGMLRQTVRTDPKVIPVLADMENLPLPDHSFDLVYSCAAMQWSHPGRALDEARRVLSQQGKLLLGTLVAGSLQEWQRAWELAGDTSRIHNLPSAEDLLKKLSGSGMQILRQRQFEHCFHYSSPESMLKDLKGLGGTHASIERPRGLLGKNTYGRFREALLGLGCTARYQILLVEAVSP